MHSPSPACLSFFYFHFFWLSAALTHDSTLWVVKLWCVYDGDLVRCVEDIERRRIWCWWWIKKRQQRERQTSVQVSGAGWNHRFDMETALHSFFFCDALCLFLLLLVRAASSLCCFFSASMRDGMVWKFSRHCLRTNKQGACWLLLYFSSRVRVNMRQSVNKVIRGNDGNPRLAAVRRIWWTTQKKICLNCV